jgi:hypothetical protein
MNIYALGFITTAKSSSNFSGGISNVSKILPGYYGISLDRFFDASDISINITPYFSKSNALYQISKGNDGSAVLVQLRDSEGNLEDSDFSISIFEIN